MNTAATGVSPAPLHPYLTIGQATWIGLLLIVGWEISGLDRPVSQMFSGPSGFAWHEWWVAVRLHDVGRWIGMGLLLLQLLSLAFSRPAGVVRSRHAAWLVVTLVCLIAVPGLKHVSQTSCPWDVIDFGGRVPYVPHWLLGVSDGGPGRCFPSGHAVAGAAFVSNYFLWRDTRPRLANVWLYGALGLAWFDGGLQVVRGAHYVSHVMWSIWLCWTLCVLVDALLRARSQAAVASTNTRTLRGDASKVSPSRIPNSRKSSDDR